MIFNNTDIFTMGIVIGMVIIKALDILSKWSELYLLNNERKRVLLLGEAVLKMQERLKGASNE